MTFMKRALVLAALAAMPAMAVAGPFVFTNTGLGGSNTFQFSSLVVSGQGSATVTLTDTDGNGVLDNSFGDTYLETGVVYGVGFKNVGSGGTEIGVSPLVSGLGINYELYAVYTPPSGALVGSAGIIGTDAVAFFSGSSFSLFYDSTIDGVLTGGSSVIGNGTNGVGNCVLPSFGAAQGTCKLTFEFSPQAGIFSVVGGSDFATYNSKHVSLDTNVDEATPSFSPVYSTPGGHQTVEIAHDGSARFAVPEPGSLALVAGALMLAGLGRRRNS